MAPDIPVVIIHCHGVVLAAHDRHNALVCQRSHLHWATPLQSISMAQLKREE